MAKSHFDTIFENFMKDEQDLGLPPEGEASPDLGGGEESFGEEGADEQVTITIDKVTAQTLCDLLQAAIGGGEEGNLDDTEGLDLEGGEGDVGGDGLGDGGFGEAWKQEQIRALGIEGFAQECDVEFISSGESAIDLNYFEELKSKVREPKYVLDNKKYLLWDIPTPGHIYGVGVDVAEGVGLDASTIDIFDFTDLTNIVQVATYHNNAIVPQQFTPKLYEILEQWGKPLVNIERNNCGAQVVDALIHTHQYENIVKYTPSMGTFTEKVDKEHRLGIFSHTNSKYNSMSNFRYWMNVLRCVKIYDKATIQEFRTYVRQANGVWKKQSDRYLDDRVEALIWSLFALDAKVVDQFYEVIEKDGNGKALKIRPHNFDPYETNVPKLDVVYNRISGGKTDEEIGVRTPSFIPYKPKNENTELDGLLEDGWRRLSQHDTPRGNNPGGFLMF